MKKLTRPVRRVVIKVGTSSLTGKSLSLSAEKIRRLTSDVMRLRRQGVDVIIVSSGAIAAGVGVLGLRERPRDLQILQATAAIGQNELMKAYGQAFGRFGQKVGQVLLTREELSDRKSYLNIKNTLAALLKIGVIPVINENDSVSVEEILSGDNDNLAAIVAVNLAAEALVMLSDSGFKMNVADAKTVPIVPQITDDIRKAARGGSARGKGGMLTKIQAAEKTINADVDMFIVDAKKKGALIKVLASPTKTTLISQNATFFPSQKKLTDREHWMLYSARPTGDIAVDDGAKQALASGGSLLPSGVVGVSGSFKAGDVVRIADRKAQAFALGEVNYGIDDVKKIMGRQSREIEKFLGRKCRCEIVYHKNMVFT